MDREQKAAKARELRDQGMTLEAISRELGYASAKGAWTLLNPERARELDAKVNRKRHQAKIAWQRQVDNSSEGRGVCSECGGPRGIGAARRPHGPQSRCRNCVRAEADRTRKRLVEMWGAGMTMQEIQRELGWTKSNLSAAITRARHLGYDLPHRHRGSYVR